MTIKTISWLLPFGVLVGILLFPHALVVTSIFSVWIAYMAYVGIAYRSQVYEVVMEMCTMLSLMGLLFLVESLALRWFFVCVSIPLFFFLVWMSSEQTGWLVHIKEKPLRRMRMMIHVFNMYAGCLVLFALNIYFPSVPFFVIMWGAGLYSALISLLIWRLYFKVSLMTLWLPIAVVAVIVSQIVWAMRLMPFGYLAQGFLVVWLWYIVQLFMRFHMSPRGLVWKQQIGFISMNVVLFIGVLFFIRWV